MLSRSHKQEYQNFLTLLNKHQILCNSLLSRTSHNKPLETMEADLVLLQRQFAEMQIWFEKHLIEITGEDIEQENLSRWQSIQTEIKREFRLLTTNVLLLKSSRQIATVATRLKNINNNLERSIGYCQVMLT